jgi:hypothetical protein
MNQCHVVQNEHAGIQGEHIGSPLPQIIQWLKTMTTNEYIKIADYIQHNPKLWKR